MKLGMEVGLGPVDIVLYGDLAPLPEKGQSSPQFLAHVCCRRTAGWIKMALGMEVGLGPGHIVLDGDPALPPLNWHSPQFLVHVRRGQMAGWTKMPTWYGGRPWPRRLCEMGTQLPAEKKCPAPHPIFGPCLLWPNGWMDEDTSWCA